ncbi:MAG: DUF58 domain-containing protein [Chloroflexota bacterium]|nr:DUF58 domain-containing protein [Chloroflexota bacterium]
MTDPLFDDPTRRKLEQLTLYANRVRAGAVKGERRSIKRGTSVEFADYRNYTPGDDLRRLDWNIYARLERPLTRLYEDEEDLSVHLLLDASASMDFPRADLDAPASNQHHKFAYARRLLAGLATVSLTTNDRLSIAALTVPDERDSDGVLHFGPARGGAYSLALLKFIGGLTAHGAVDLNAMLKNYAARSGRAGLVVVISDLFAAAGFAEGLNALVGKGHEVAVVHVLAPEEIDPPLEGDLRLIDSETGLPQEVSIDGGMRVLYRKRVEAWRDDLRAECRRRGAHYLPVTTDQAWERIILTDLRRLGVVK